MYTIPVEKNYKNNNNNNSNNNLFVQPLIRRTNFKSKVKIIKYTKGYINAMLKDVSQHINRNTSIFRLF